MTPKKEKQDDISILTLLSPPFHNLLGPKKRLFPLLPFPILTSFTWNCDHTCGIHLIAHWKSRQRNSDNVSDEVAQKVWFLLQNPILLMQGTESYTFVFAFCAGTLSFFIPFLPSSLPQEPWFCTCSCVQEGRVKSYRLCLLILIPRTMAATLRPWSHLDKGETGDTEESREDKWGKKLILDGVIELLN